MSTVAEQTPPGSVAENLTGSSTWRLPRFAPTISARWKRQLRCFSAPVYIRGFVRGYAKLLKLDVPQIMAALDAELGQTTKFAEPPPLAERPQTFVHVFTLQLRRWTGERG